MTDPNRDKSRDDRFTWKKDDVVWEYIPDPPRESAEPPKAPARDSANRVHRVYIPPAKR